MKDGLQLKCDLCGGLARDENDAHRHHWDWFTGRLLATFHVCATCQGRRLKELDEKRREAGIEA